MSNLLSILNEFNSIIKNKDVEKEEVEILTSHMEAIEDHISLDIKPKEEFIINLNKILNLYKI